MNKSNIECPVCGSKQNHKFENEDFLFKCDDCRVVFQYPIQPFDYSGYPEIRSPGQKKRLEQYKLDIPEIMQYAKGGSFLDVGCGKGTFLSQLPNGFKKFGIDIRDTSYYKGGFTDYPFEEKFDVIQMRAVIEHLPNPISFIKRAYELLNNDGLLIVSHTPNIDNYPLMKGIMPIEHVVYFSPFTLPPILEKHGFKIIDIKFPYYGTPYEHETKAHFGNAFSVFARRK